MVGVDELFVGAAALLLGLSLGARRRFGLVGQSVRVAAVAPAAWLGVDVVFTLCKAGDSLSGAAEQQCNAHVAAAPWIAAAYVGGIVVLALVGALAGRLGSDSGRRAAFALAMLAAALAGGFAVTVSLYFPLTVVGVVAAWAIWPREPGRGLERFFARPAPGADE